MKCFKIILSFLILLCQYSLASKQLFAQSIFSHDSTHVDFFYMNYENLDLGKIYSLDTTTLLSSYSEPLDQSYEIFQTLSNSGLAHKNLSFIYTSKLGFNTELPSFISYIHNNENIKSVTE